MTKNLLHTVMIKPEEKPVHPIDIAGLEAKIKEGYTNVYAKFSRTTGNVCHRCSDPLYGNCIRFCNCNENSRLFDHKKRRLV